MGATLVIGSQILTGLGSAALVKKVFFDDPENARKSAQAQQEMADQQKAAIEDQRKQREDQQKKENDLKAQQQALASANTDKDLAQTRQRKLAMQGQSYRDTILTSPLGIPAGNAPNLSRKTLLGM